VDPRRRGDRAGRDPADGGQGSRGWRARRSFTYTETGKTLPTLTDSGAQTNLVDKEEIKVCKPGVDDVELHGDTPELHAFGALKVAERRIAIIHDADQVLRRRADSPPTSAACGPPGLQRRHVGRQRRAKGVSSKHGPNLTCATRYALGARRRQSA
jgi:hypothetical protein